MSPRAVTTKSRLDPPAAVREIVRTLEKGGHEAWCVGGAVRDALLGIPTLDWDIATSARPEEVQRLFKRTVPVGIAFGTVGVLDRAGVLHEVTTFRHDVETDGRHAVVAFGASLDEDLARRDFTVNAIAVHPETKEIRDPFDGRGDLERGLIRCVGVAEERMKEDRLRALRALRFAGRFDFEIEPSTWAAIRGSAPRLTRLSMERVKQELEKVMEQVRRPSRTLERYREAGILRSLIPVIADAPGARFAAIDHLGMPGPKGRPERRMLRLVALFFEPGEGVGDRKGFERTLKGLKFSNVEVRATLELCEAGALVGPDVVVVHLTSHLSHLTSAPEPSAALRRLIAKIGRTNLASVSRLLWARVAAEGGGSFRAGAADYRRAMQIAWNDPLTINDLAVDGEDLRHAGVEAGPAMRATLDRLLDAVLEDPSRNTRDELLALIHG